MSYRVLLVGGGSGGHVYPLIAVANALKIQAGQKNINLDLMLIGDGGFAEDAARKNGISFRKILAGKFRRYYSVLSFLDILKLPLGFIQSLWYVYLYMPDVIFTKGGHVSFLPAVVGSIYRIPVYTHESDSVPGLANRLIARMARKIFISFPKSEKYFNGNKAVLTGNPVRKELFGRDTSRALESFKLAAGKKTILVLGGSQGAQKINDIILKSIVKLVKEYQVIHQCGDSQFQGVKEEVAKIIKDGEENYGQLITDSYRLYPFFNSEDLSLAYAAADIIISRAGSGSIFEIAYTGKPAIVIPISESAGNHQFHNAVALGEFGGIVIDENNLTVNILLNQIGSLLQADQYQNTSNRIKDFARPDAADHIAEVLLSI